MTILIFKAKLIFFCQIQFFISTLMSPGDIKWDRFHFTLRSTHQIKTVWITTVWITAVWITTVWITTVWITTVWITTVWITTVWITTVWMKTVNVASVQITTVQITAHLVATVQFFFACSVIVYFHIMPL
jgi:hypothetical protein